MDYGEIYSLLIYGNLHLASTRLTRGELFYTLIYHSMETQAEELARLSYAFNVDPDVIKIAFDI